jgi:predicted ribosome quality control (RQC) complex YloA/Tae2 family protein
MALQQGGGASLTLSATHVAELSGELAPLFEGGRLARVQALPPRDLVLVFERPAPPRLLLSANPDAPRLCALSERPPPHKGPLGPFYQQVADELAGARLARLAQVAGDRAVTLAFDETSSGERRTLVLELFGRRANLLLLGPAERVRASLAPLPQPAPGVRTVLGAPWAPPARGPGRAEPPATPLATSLPEPEQPAPPLGTDPGSPTAPLSWRVECALGRLAAELQRARLAKELGLRLERRLERARGLVHGLEEKLAAARGAERVLQDGELLKAHMHLLKPGLESIELDDLYVEGAAKRRIALDPRRSPRANVERVFARYKKLVRAEESVAQELSRARAQVQALQELHGRLQDEQADPLALGAEALARGLVEREQEADLRKRPPPEPRRPYREFTALHGSSVLVGRSAADNDELTLRIARGNDLWLHTRDAPGSHVVLRLPKGREPDEEEVLDAAHLAAHFSPLREARRVAVHVALRKLVHKPRGAKPGLVSLSGGRVIELRVQPERLQRLLESARRPAPGTPSDPSTPEPT